MSPRTGRPPVENPKTDRITVRLHPTEMEHLEQCAEALGTTKADVIQRGLELMTVQLKYPKSRELFEEIMNAYCIMLCNEMREENDSIIPIEETLKLIESKCKDFTRSIK